MKKIIFALFCFYSVVVKANFDGYQLNMMLGMTSVTFAENASALKQENTNNAPAEPKSGNASVIPLAFEVEKFTDASWSWVAKGVIPLMSSATGNYLFAGIGKNWYFKSISSQASFSSENGIIKIVPKWRFHLTGGLGVAYLVYLTETAKKTDILAEIFFGGGVTKTINKKWSIRGEATLSRGIGVATTTTTMKAFVGGIMSL